MNPLPTHVRFWRRHFYVFDSTKILPGDILLSRSQKSVQSAVIRWASRSEYSHAAICFRPPAFIEAVSLGARGFSIDEVAIRSLDSVRVLRLKDDVPYARELREAAAVSAATRLQSEYWTTGALLSVDPEATLPQRSRYFCSHLVAQAYYDAGLRSGKDPSKTLPNDFLAWPVIDVTKDILRQERSTPGIRRTFYDDPKVESAHDPLVKVSQAVCRRVRETFLAHGLGEPGNFQETLAALLVIKDSSTAAAIDCAFLSALNETGFKEYFHKAIVNEYQSFFYDMDWVAKLVKLLTVRRSKLAPRLCDKFVTNRLNALKRHYAAYSSDWKLCETAVSDLASSIYSLNSEIPWKTFSGVFLEAHERTGFETYRVIGLMLQDLDEGREFGRQGLGHLINLLEARLSSGDAQFQDRSKAFLEKLCTLVASKFELVEDPIINGAVKESHLGRGVITIITTNKFTDIVSDPAEMTDPKIYGFRFSMVETKIVDTGIVRCLV